MIIKNERIGIEKKFYDAAQEIVKDQGYELYDLNYINGSKTLRVYIVDPETNTAVITDCVKVDKAFSPYMEENDWIPEEIVLEVSSPGLYRSLTTLQHFKWALDEQIQVQLSKTLGELLDGEELDKKVAKTKKFLALLEEVSDEYVVVKLDKDFSLKLKYEDIKKANLEPELS